MGEWESVSGTKPRWKGSCLSFVQSRGNKGRQEYRYHLSYSVYYHPADPFPLSLEWVRGSPCLALLSKRRGKAACSTINLWVWVEKWAKVSTSEVGSPLYSCSRNILCHPLPLSFHVQLFFPESRLWIWSVKGPVDRKEDERRENFMQNPNTHFVSLFHADIAWEKGRFRINYCILNWRP